MHIPDSSEKGGVPAANRTPPQNQNLDAQLLPDPTILGNSRRLIRVEGGAPLYEVFVISSYFELVSDSERWRFNELWESVIGQIRLAERSAQ